jgi:hypothetical protein
MSYATFERHFYRCGDCLHVFALDGPQRLCNVVSPASLRCDCGSQRVAYMGRVGPDGAVGYTEERCACDSRCTSARGPICNCSCGGANHGTGATVRVRIDNTAATIEPQADLPERLAALTAFRDACATARDAIDALPHAADVAAGKWVANRAAWERVFYARQSLRNAGNLKTHAARMRAVAKVIAIAQQVQP